MTNDEIASALGQLTGTLKPVQGTSAADLQAGRAGLAASLAHGLSTAQIAPTTAVHPTRSTADISAGADAGLYAEIAAAVASALPAGNDLPSQLAYLQSLTSTQGGAPAWAEGMEIQKSLGPFEDEHGIPGWIQIIGLTQSRQFAYGSATQVFGVFPVRTSLGVTPPSELVVELAAGSVWFPANWLAAASPADRFTGFRIQHGRLTFESAPALQGAVMVIPAGTKFTLDATLDPPAATPPANGPGADENHAVVHLPETVRIAFAPGQARVTALANSALSVYGSTAQLTWNQQPAAYSAERTQIEIPCACDASTFTFANVRSAVFQPAGTAAIPAAGWALPAPETTVSALGEAAGAGSLFLGLQAGITAVWRTHPEPQSWATGMIEASPGSLEVRFTGLVAAAATHSFEWWFEEPAVAGRRSTVDFVYTKKIELNYLNKADTETVLVTGRAVAHLDRPLQADGSRLAFTSLHAQLAIVATAAKTTAVVIGAAAAKDARVTLALENALLGVEPPRLFTMAASLGEAGEVEDGKLTWSFPTRWILPTLPDPYAASFSNGSLVEQPSNLGTLNVWLDWGGAKSPVMRLNLVAAATSSGEQPTGIEALIAGDPPGLAAVAVRLPDAWVLLDLSTKASQFGVSIQSPAARKSPDVTGSERFGFQGLELAFNQAFLATFALPQVSWEPMLSEQTPQGFITPGPFAGDGGPLHLQAPDFQTLTPVAPLPVLASQVKNVHAGLPFQARFGLPFGLLARIDQPNSPVTEPQVPGFLALGGKFELNQPAFPQQGLTGAHQLTLEPTHPDAPNATFAGTAHVYPFPAPLDEQGLPNGYGYTVLSQDVGIIFEQEFGTPADGGPRTVPIQPGVPLRRIDLAGYGASIFSEWQDENPPLPAITKVQFSTMVGRTGFEVVQAATLVYPYAVRMVRTVTLKRKLAGWVDRTDSGWQPASPGTFDFPAAAGFAGRVHRGGVLGVYNVRHVREQTEVRTVHTSAKFTFRKVLFDADVGIDRRLGVQSGAFVSDFLDADGQPIHLVPSQDLVGYLQLTPAEDPAGPDELAALIAQTGPFTPPLQCELTIGSLGGKPGFGLRGTSLEVAMATEGGPPALAAAVRGAPLLPRDGAWGVGVRGRTEAAPHFLAPDAAVPLVQAAGDPSTWHFADPTDVLQLANPASLYSFLQDTGTQKLLFEQPRVPQAGVGGVPGLQLPNPPNLADVASLLNSTGLFPDVANAITLATGAAEHLENLKDGLRYTKKYTFPADKASLTLADLDVIQVAISYADESKGRTGADANAPTVVTVVIDPTKDPRWSFSITPITFMVTVPLFSDQPLIEIVGGFAADDHTKPHLTDLHIVFGDALSVVESIFSKLQALAQFLPGGKGSGLKVGLSNGKLTVQDNFAVPTLPLGLGELTDVSLDIGLGVQLSPLKVDFSVGIGGPQNPFNWIVSPLAGNGSITLGVTDNQPNLDIQAGIGLGLAIDLGIASGSASVTIAVNLDVNGSSITLMLLLTGQASVDVLDGLASASLTLTAGVGVKIDPPPVPKIKIAPPEVEFPAETITMLASVSVGIHISICWVVSIDFDGSWQFSQSFHTPELDVSL